MEYNKCIADMLPGMDVEGFYILRAAALKTTNSGKPFLSGTICDRDAHSRPVISSTPPRNLSEMAARCSRSAFISTRRETISSVHAATIGGKAVEKISGRDVLRR